MNYIDAKTRQTAAEKRLKRILQTEDRKQQEEQFAKDHSSDTDKQLCDYVKEQKMKDKNFDRMKLIGYQYIVERFGDWRNVITLVNQMIAEEKGKEVQRE